MEIGEYVRTKEGLIDKIENYSFGCNVWHCENGMCIDECNSIGTHLKDVTKHSKNIIDLIENQDILKIKTKKNEILFVGADENTTNLKYEEVIEELKNEEYELLGILTKEQYEANCYKLED